MAASPRFKVYDSENEYLASFKYVEDAAILVAAKHDGTTIRLGHNKSHTVWTEGKDGSAAASYMDVAILVEERMRGREIQS